MDPDRTSLASLPARVQALRELLLQQVHGSAGGGLLHGLGGGMHA